MSFFRIRLQTRITCLTLLAGSLCSLTVNAMAVLPQEDQVQHVLDLADVSTLRDPRFVEPYEKLADLGQTAVPDLIRLARNAPIHSTQPSLAVDALSDIQDPAAIPCSSGTRSHGKVSALRGERSIPQGPCQVWKRHRPRPDQNI